MFLPQKHHLIITVHPDLRVSGDVLAKGRALSCLAMLRQILASPVCGLYAVRINGRPRLYCTFAVALLTVLLSVGGISHSPALACERPRSWLSADIRASSSQGDFEEGTHRRAALCVPAYGCVLASWFRGR